MSAKLIAVEGAGLSAASGVVVIVPATTVMSQKIKADQKAAYHAIGVLVTAGQNSGTGVIQGSSQKAKSNSMPFVREDDQCETTGTLVTTVTVQAAGQTKVKAE